MIGDTHIQRIARGDAIVFEQLFKLWSERMYFYATKITGNQELSKDIIQESFLAYWNKRDSFDTALVVKAFLYGSIKNQIFKHSRDNLTHKRILESLDEIAPPTTDDLIVAAEISGQVQKAVGALPSQTKKVIELSMNGLKVEEIAREMGISVNSVKTLKKSGYKHLREKLHHLRAILFLLFT